MTGEPQDALVDAMQTGGWPAPATGPGGILSDADRALLRYVTKLTLTPGRMDAADVESLRAAGFDDRAIHDACAIASYYAFVNRIADGLGVELEPGRDRDEG